MILFLYIPFAIYICSFIFLLIGFWRSSKKIAKLDSKPISISIIIPFRNEMLRWDKLLKSLEILQTGSCEVKIFFIDDHSDDGGFAHLAKWKESVNKNITLLSLDTNLIGKKEAINLGISNADTDWIFTLDADSYISDNFLQNFIIQMDDNSLVYLLPVVENDNGFFMSKIESNVLFNINYSAVCFNRPLLANGAGMIFRKEIFLKLNPYHDNLDVFSGDDLFFLEKLMPIYRFQIRALKRNELIVFTTPPKSYYEMLCRSVRWSGKMKLVNLFQTKFIGLTVFFCNISLIPITFFHLYNTHITALIAILSLKLILDLGLLFINHYNAINLSLIMNVFFTFIFYPFHLLIVFSYSIFNRAKWKGRAI
ncbi:MAG: glycosyltransferase [Flavobacteriales bacterium]|nr:glycosyltransferase [Flavobacteriales bacterium]